jgi:hypothetical protein
VDVPHSTRTVLATRDDLFSANEQLALAGFLAGYSGLTRDAYTLDLRQYVAWCTEHHLAVFGARRAVVVASVWVADEAAVDYAAQRWVTLSSFAACFDRLVPADNRSCAPMLCTEDRTGGGRPMRAIGARPESLTRRLETW